MQILMTKDKRRKNKLFQYDFLSIPPISFLDSIYSATQFTIKLFFYFFCLQINVEVISRWVRGSNRRKFFYSGRSPIYRLVKFSSSNRGKFNIHHQQLGGRRDWMRATRKCNKVSSLNCLGFISIKGVMGENFKRKNFNFRGHPWCMKKIRPGRDFFHDVFYTVRFCLKLKGQSGQGEARNFNSECFQLFFWITKGFFNIGFKFQSKNCKIKKMQL